MLSTGMKTRELSSARPFRLPPLQDLRTISMIPNEKSLPLCENPLVLQQIWRLSAVFSENPIVSQHLTTRGFIHRKPTDKVSSYLKKTQVSKPFCDFRKSQFCCVFWTVWKIFLVFLDKNIIAIRYLCTGMRYILSIWNYS